MSNYKEKRNYSRSFYTAPVICVDPRGEKKTKFGELGNYSRKGMYFETDMELGLQEQITLKMKDYSPVEPGPEGNQAYQGQVRWSKPMPANTTSYKFGYGIEFPYEVELG